MKGVLTLAATAMLAAVSAALLVTVVRLRPDGPRVSAARRYARLLPYPRRQWRSLSLVTVATIAFSATTALAPWPTKLLVDFAFADAEPPDAVVTWLGR